jgi:hypothetical protein
MTESDFETSLGAVISKSKPLSLARQGPTQASLCHSPARTFRHEPVTCSAGDLFQSPTANFLVGRRHPL